MKLIRGIEFCAGSREERLPDFAPDFPYIASRAEMDFYPERFVPWHWHSAVELFYMESGSLEYSTPQGKAVFPQGSGGFVNSNVLHMTRPLGPVGKNVQLVHLFDPGLIAGPPGSRIGQKYVLPLAAAQQVELAALRPGDPAQEALLERVRAAFCLSEQESGYEIRLRSALSEIWLGLFELLRPRLEEPARPGRSSEKLKALMAYIHEHYADRIGVAELAASAYLSERECFRLFRDCLHTTPAAYIRSYRLQAACQMLARSEMSLTEIGRASGLGSSSYFGKLFREAMGCTPSEYRRRWQDPAKNGQDRR